ncbi:hypothetical protein VPH35_097357 [Triticum aestivum]
MVGVWRARRRVATSWPGAAAQQCCVAAWSGRGELANVSLRAGRARLLGSAALQHRRGMASSPASHYELTWRGSSAMLRCRMARPLGSAAFQHGWGMSSWPVTVARRSHSTALWRQACRRGCCNHVLRIGELMSPSELRASVCYFCN